ncbi:SpoIIE family protein phosphatase [candidate division KSB1 bacterium]|nr:SpoIIE family protein phosphatase [candidate division KSB1 bacterium]
MASILLVDDDKSILLFLTAILSKTSHTVTSVLGGAEALKNLEKNEYDLIVSDLQMPDIDGLKILKEAKEKYPNTEVLILTGYGSIKTAVKAMKSGAFEYLSKPVDIDEFKFKVEQALQHREMRLKLEANERELEEYHAMLERDLRLSTQVQESLVPQPLENDRIEISVKHLPMIGVGGDFADVYYDGNRYVYLNLIDVTGHGITAALLVNRTCSELRKLIREQLYPNEIIYNLNNFIVDVFYRTGMFLTMFSCMIDLKELKCIYCGAAHPPLLLWNHRHNDIKQLASQNTIVGYEQIELKDIQQSEIDLRKEDKLLMYTDGLTEFEERQNMALGIEGLIKIVEKNIHEETKHLPEKIIQELNGNRKKKMTDDIFIIVAHLK